MSERYDIYVNGKEVARDDIRACPPVGSTVELADGQELEVVRVVYPVGRRVRLECKTSGKPEAKKPEPKVIVEPAKPAVEPEEEKKDEPRRSRK